METNSNLLGNFAVTMIAKKSRKVVTLVCRTDCRKGSPFRGKRILSLGGIEQAPPGMADWAIQSIGVGKLQNSDGKPDVKCVLDKKFAFVAKKGYINIFDKVKDEADYEGNDPKKLEAKKISTMLIKLRAFLVLPPQNIANNYTSFYTQLCMGCNRTMIGHRNFVASDGSSPLPFSAHKCFACADGYVHVIGDDSLSRR